MTRFNPYEFVDLGACVQGLENLEPSHRVVPQVLVVMFQIAEALKSFRAKWIEAHHLSPRGCDRLIAEIDAVMPDGANALIPGGRFGEAANHLSSAATDFRTALEDELGRIPAFALDSPRGYDIRKLLADQESFLSDAGRAALADPADADNWREGRKCLAFQRWTAAVFHFQRVLESLARRYFRLLNGRDVAAGTTLFQILGKLEEVAPADTLAALNAARVAYRNPTMHPGAVIGEDDALDVFASTQGLINRIGADMSARSLKGNE